MTALTRIEPRAVRPITRIFLSEYLVLALTVILVLLVAPFTPDLITVSGLLNALSYLLPLLIVAIGMTLVLITGGIDLSVTSTIALTSVVGATVMTDNQFPAPLGVAVMMALGATMGAANGTMVSLMRLPPFIVTLASMMFAAGFAVWFTQSKNIYNLPPQFLALGNRLPLALAIASLVGVAVHLVLSRTIYGRWLYAVGHNATAARIAGVPVEAMTFSAYVASGICAALASVLLTARLETGSPVMGREMLLDIIGATVVGGTSLFGGKGKVMWTLFGVLFLTILDQALNFLNLSQFSITIAKGLVILFAAVVDATRQRLAC